MPLAGKGMLITWMDIDPTEEQDFNLWYDREHLAERVAIDGFLEARRWAADKAPTKYFCTYSTDTFEALNSPAYKKVLANQTDWSKKHISRFRNPGRVVGRTTVDGAVALDRTMKNLSSGIDGALIHYNGRHMRRGSGADAVHRTRSCGRGIPAGSSR